VCKNRKMVGFKPLDREPTLGVKLISAGTAGCLADIGTYPLDLAKVRLMTQGESGTGAVQAAAKLAPTQFKYKSLPGTIATVAKEEGLLALYNGLVPGLQRQMCFASIRLGLYDTVKGFYTQYFGSEKPDAKNIPLRIAAGISTGGFAVICAQPTDVVKIRMQAPGGKQRYNGSLNAYRTIARTEGIRGLWKGCLPNVARNAIVNAAELVSYDLVKETILHHKLLSDNIPCHFVSAFCAGFITTIFASPVDVVKTRFMNSSKGQYKGALDCAYVLFKERGFFGFYKGFVPNYIRLGSWNILMFILFEQCKRGYSQIGSSS